MIAYKPGQVILVPFPFTDFATVKKRPALIISSDSFNQTHEDMIIIAITSKNPEKTADDELFLPEPEQKAAGLLKLSKVKTGKIVSIDKRLVRKTLGQITNNTLSSIIQLVVKNLASTSSNNP